MAQTPPVPIDPASWVTNDDYPAEAMKNGESGLIAFETQVDANGKPISCRTTTSSGSANLDATTCRLVMARASFRPATDAKNGPVTGKWSMRFRWSLPSTVVTPTPIRSFGLIEHLTFDAEGKITGCNGRASGEIGTELPVCLRVGDMLVVSQFMTGRYRNGVATRTVTQLVEGDPMRPDAPTSDVPPNWTMERRFTLQADGRVADCSQRESGKGIVPCETPTGYAPPSDGHPHRVTFETRWVFQPAK
ncbi:MULTISPECIES: energy transducer TonB [unclassified Sphingomonas]|uniref:energy transducer TonB n=1 Tax=unclassified Sphingomonas TaxID=196159 RepID=UPI0006F3CEDD|nr:MULTISPECIES: energy transducer TonB [unclassified Sphingomonas]KQM57276.1 hypothetical protein ASE65_13235 [Sphingomonas sp. Leaf16]KQN10451.1 hypothetical protein ASE81_13280 [Sphingomonas sp. Leaf29]KQN18252.1 hypothetical protein ASE83_13215 [Sphingomonas sp. Leaf32]